MGKIDVAVKMIVKLNVKQERLADFKSLASELGNSVEVSEPSTLGYEWFMSTSDNTCYVVETYTDSNALLSHLDKVGIKLTALFELAALGELLVFGALSEQAAKVLAGLGAQVFPLFTGFSRSA